MKWNVLRDYKTRVSVAFWTRTGQYQNLSITTDQDNHHSFASTIALIKRKLRRELRRSQKILVYQNISNSSKAMRTICSSIPSRSTCCGATLALGLRCESLLAVHGRVSDQEGFLFATQR